MKITLPLLALLCLQLNPLRAQVWSITEMPESLNGLSIATHGNKIIMAGAGTVAGNSVSDTVYIYDAVTGEFEITHLPLAREAMATVTLGDKVMFAGGAVFTVGVGYNNTTDTVQVYDLNTGEWSIEKLSVPRRWVTAQAINGKAYFAGGREPSGPYTDVLDIYDPVTDTWTLDTLPLPVRSAASAVAGDKLLLFLENNCQILHTAGRKPDKTPKTDDEKLDQALDQSFPASDPPAQTEPAVNVRSKKKPIHEKA